LSGSRREVDGNTCQQHEFDRAQTTISMVHWYMVLLATTILVPQQRMLLKCQ
jgi:hypothetical protein